MQQSWAYTNRVNLLAAGSSTRGATGSGIYSGRQGALQAIMAIRPTIRALVAKVPKKPYASADYTELAPERGQPSRSNQNIWRENLDSYQLKLLNFDQNASQNGRACFKSICCEYNVTASIRNGNARSV